MPDVDSFLDGFGLSAGQQLGSFKIVSATGSHEVIRQYHEYLYHFTITLETDPKTDSEVAIAELLHIFREISKTVLSIKAIRNYYFCRIERPNSDNFRSTGNGQYVAKLIGHSKR